MLVVETVGGRQRQVPILQAGTAFPEALQGLPQSSLAAALPPAASGRVMPFGRPFSGGQQQPLWLQCLPACLPLASAPSELATPTQGSAGGPAP